MTARRDLLQESLAAIERLQARVRIAEQGRHEPIAILGAACRFPGGVEDLDGLWRVLEGGINAVTDIPADRWDVGAYYDPDPKAPGKMSTRRGGFLRQVDQFDPRFFGISPREAATMDPQQRLLLETAWEALESGAMSPERLAGSSTGVFVGITTSDYGQLLRLGAPESADVYSATGVALNAAAGRLSFVLGLQGPCVAVDTACSSSLVALHLACQSLRSGECDLALAGGVNVILSPDAMVLFSKWGMMAPDGHCKTFDARADGFARGEGCAVLALKRLSEAQADGDPILALIRGSASNQDGRSSGLTVPNGLAQQQVIRHALASAGLEPRDIDYVEAHGTGTSLGDPIEVEALGAVLGANRPASDPLLIGSVKTNLGHTEAVSGLAGLLKVVASLQHETIPPHLHFSTPNPRIPWASLPLAVTKSAVPWKRGERVRRAGVSSFGFSGTNAHVIVEEAPLLPPVGEEPRGATIVPLAARDTAALRAVVQRQLEDLGQHRETRLVDRARTLAVGRAHGLTRLALVAESSAQLEESLASWLGGTPLPGTAEGRFRAGERPRIAFLFTGQGAQYPGMGLSLYQTEPVFRAALDRCAELLAGVLPRPLLEVLHGLEGAGNLLDETGFTQPALFALEYALAELWRSWGIVPSVVLGHSVGEFVAACVAGVMTLEDAVGLLATRARLMQALPPGGAMGSIFAPVADVEAALAEIGHAVTVAARNGPEHVVVSGTAGAVDAVIARFEPLGVRCQRLAVSHAFHSPLVEPMLDAFEAEARQVTYRPPRITMISNVTGEPLPLDRPIDAAYWRRHARQPVRFHASVEAALARCDVVLEVGPAPVLLSMASHAFPQAQVAWLASMRKGRGERREMLTALGEMYVRGAPVNWDAVTSSVARRVALPTYPFQRERYWHEVERRDTGTALAALRRRHPLLGGRLASALPVFQGEIGLGPQPWLSDHRIFEFTLFPGTGFLELALAAAREALNDEVVELRDLAIREGLRLPDDGTVSVQVVLTPGADESLSVQVFSRAAPEGEAAAPWRLHASASAVRAVARPAPRDLSALQRAAARSLDIPAYYERLAAQGIHYGPTFRGITSIARGERNVLGRVRIDDAAAADAAVMLLHPALLDACFQLIGLGLPWADSTTPADDAICVPVGLAAFRVYQSGVTAAWCDVVNEPAGADGDLFRADLTLLDEEGEVLAEVRGLELRRTSRAALQRALAQRATPEWAWQVDWPAVPLPAAAARHTPARWLVFADAAGLADALAGELEARGDGVVRVRTGSSYQADGTTWHLDPHDPAQFHRVLADAAGRDTRPLGGIVFLWPLDEAGGGADIEALSSAQQRLLTATTHLARALPDATARLWFVTRGTQAVEGALPDLAQAPAWGLAGVVASELPALQCTRIDLDPAPRDDEARTLFDTLTRPDAEDRIAWRGGVRHVARLVPSPTAPADDTPRRLEITERGTLENLTLRTVAREAPGPGEVEIRVHATGLNFRDVLNALGMYPGDPGPLGNECAGVVTAVGEGVTDLQVGDDALAMVDRSFATWVVAPAALTVRKPASLTHAEAATIPVTFLTAQYALHDLARIKQGDRVLVHAVTGGVGMAALQLALRAGAKVFGTAGSPAKRALALALGAHHVADSRSLSFEDDVRRATDGQGVDIVLNSLAGEFIPASLRLLRPGGHFVEIGKTAIWDAERVAREFPGVNYHALYLGEVAAARPLFLRDMLRELLVEIDAGRLTSLPQRSWPIERAEEAFRFMGQGHHTGKIVITQHPPAPVRADASYLVTGGLGGLGLACARGLVEAGARHVVLLGRRAPSPAAETEIAAMRAAGATVTVAQADVADATRLGAVLAGIEPPLRGVLHAAGRVDDAMLAELTPSRFDTVMSPKVRGTWNLHALTDRSPLDFFVMFSSGAALLGSPGQGNYAAANSFMDALAHRRRARGAPALSINWGSWSGVGMAAAVDERHQRRWASMGLAMIAPEDGVQMLQTLLAANRGAQVAALPLVPGRLPEQLAPFYAELLARRRHAAALLQPRDPALSREPGWRARLTASAPNRRRAVLREQVRQLAARVLGLPRVDELNVDEPLRQLGLDSLMAVELGNLLGKAVGQTLPATVTFDHPSVAALVEHLATTHFVAELAVPAAASTAPAAPASGEAAALDAMSEAELALQLLNRLDGIAIRGKS